MSETTPTTPTTTPHFAAAEPWRLSDQELTAALVGQEAVLRREQARLQGLVGELLRRGPGAVPYRGPAEFFREKLRWSRREVRERMEQAEATQPGRGVAGEAVPAPLAATGQALADGRIGMEHAAVLVRVFARCPRGVSSAERAECERILLELAATANPDALREAGRKLIAYWQADGDPPRDSELHEPRRELRYRHKRNGELEFSGVLDRETAATLEGLLGPLAKPRPAAEGCPDPRSTAQRQGDALAEIVELAARADDLAVQGGERAVITATVTLAELRSQARRVLLDTPCGLSLDALRRLACEAELVPAIYGAQGEVLYLGRSVRHATKAQRRALALRDGGCAYPGCTRPPKYCVAHHIRFWSQDGPTDLDNLVLLCAHHHRVLHHTEWEVRINPTDQRPEFLPPARLDPRRRPLRNTAHHILTRANQARRQHQHPPDDSPWQPMVVSA